MTSNPSLIDLLPEIAACGKREAEQILERLSGPNRIGLQTSEYIIPSKAQRDQYLKFSSARSAALREGDWLNRLLYGDNLLVMQALLAGDEASGRRPCAAKST